MFEPLRQTGFVTTMTMILTGLFSLLAAILVNEVAGQPPALRDNLPYRVAARADGTAPGRWPNFGDILSSAQPKTPHPAVARIIVPEGAATAYGTGTLVDVRDEYGLVVTNWHVVRDATGIVEVTFPDGFRSQARALKVDPDWDLAALVVWRPPVEPVPLADRAPRPGESLTIHGYGQGDYRVARGKCTQYYAPRPDFPQEMLELNVEARQGDSGGPIFNEHGDLAGVLFGAGQGTTIGSFGGRVESFLATLAPDIGKPQPGEDGQTQLAENPPGLTGPPDPSSLTTERSGWSNPERDAVATNSASDAQKDWQLAAAENWSATDQPLVDHNDDDAETDSIPAAEVRKSAETASGTSRHFANRFLLLERIKSVLAVIGLYTVCIHIVRMVS